MNSLFAREQLPDAAGRVVAGKYVLDRALAAGGMGSVWSAWNTQLDVPVAIKFMAPGLAGSAELVARFEREARAAAQIRSPHVVQIFEHGVEDGQPFIVMELLEGEDFGQRMRREGRLSLQETARVVRQVCRALRRAHALGIVHRDLKPANIFLSRGDDDEDLTVKVLDFGVVKSIGEAVDSGVTKTGELIGTPHYMSPEQARSVKSVDHRSDLWSLAVIAYRALTASLPFPDEEGIEMLLRVCSEHAPPPSFYAPHLGADVDAYFQMALAIDPDHRFQTAREMADALDCLAGLPPSRRSDSLNSFPDSPPPSSRAFPAHAYVYTSASSLDRRSSTPPSTQRPSMDLRASTPPNGQRRPSAPELRASTPPNGQRRPSAPELRASTPPNGQRRPSVPELRASTPPHGQRRPSAPPSSRRRTPSVFPPSLPVPQQRSLSPDDPTRISASIATPAARAQGGPHSRPIAIVPPAGMEDTAPAPGHALPEELTTIEHAGVERAALSVQPRIFLARPGLTIAASATLVLLLVASVFLAPLESRDDRAQAAPNKLTWTSALGADLPAQPAIPAPLPSAPAETVPAVSTAPLPAVATADVKPPATTAPRPPVQRRGPGRGWMPIKTSR